MRSLPGASPNGKRRTSGLPARLRGSLSSLGIQQVGGERSLVLLLFIPCQLSCVMCQLLLWFFVLSVVPLFFLFSTLSVICYLFFAMCSCYVLLVIYYSLCGMCQLLFVTCYALVVICYLLVIICVVVFCSLSVVLCYVLLVMCSLLLAICSMFFVTCQLFFGMCSLLYVTYQLLIYVSFVSWFLSSVPGFLVYVNCSPRDILYQVLIVPLLLLSPFYSCMLYSLLTPNTTTSLSLPLIPATCDISTHNHNDIPAHTPPSHDTQPHRQFTLALYH